MQHIKLYFLILYFLSNAGSQGQAQALSDAKNLAFLKQFRTQYAQSVLGKNPNAISAYFSENIRLMPAFQKTVLGKQNAVLYHQAFFHRFEVQAFSRDEIEILDLGTQVLEIGKLNMKVRLKSNQQEQNLEGTYLNLWEKTTDKGLLLLTEAWNYNGHYGEFHEQLKFEEVPGVYVALQPNVLVDNSLSFELAALNRLLDETVTDHDADIWKQFYAGDAMLIPSYHPICQGRKAIDEYIDLHAKELPIFEELDIRNDHIDNLGVYVIEYASHIAGWKNGASSGVGLGKNIRIWRREPDHSLKLFRSMGMYD